VDVNVKQIILKAAVVELVIAAAKCKRLPEQVC
jgi:hypothetical protein